MPTLEELEYNEDFQNLPEQEKVKVKRIIFEKRVSKNPEFLALNLEDKKIVASKFLIPTESIAEPGTGLVKRALSIGKTLISPIPATKPLRERGIQAIEAARPKTEQVVRGLAERALPGSFLKGLARRAPFTPGQALEQIGIESITPSPLDIATLGISGIAKITKPISKIPEGLESTTKIIEKIKSPSFSGKEIFDNPDKIKEFVDPILKLKSLEDFVEEAVKFAKVNPQSPLVVEKTKMISDRLAEAINSEDIVTDLVTKVGKGDAAQLLKEARTMAGRTLNRLSQLQRTIGSEATKQLEGTLKQFVPNYLDKATELFTAFKLTNPITYLRNATGNTLALLTRMADNLSASGIDFIKSEITGAPRQKFAAEAAYGTWEGLKKGPQIFLDNLIKGTEFGKTQEIAQRVAIGGRAGEVVRLPFRILGATDEAFKSIIRTQELHSMAYRQSVKEGLKGQSRFNRIKELVSNPPEEFLNKAENVSKEFTFTNDLPKYLKGLELARNWMPGAKLIIPFLRTPANIARFMVKRTPLGLVSIQKQGIDLTTENLARIINGSILAGSLTAIASEGYITGEPPKDKRAREILFNSGWNPFSVKIGDRYFSYRGLEPISSFMAQAVKIAELSNKGNKEPPSEMVNDFIFSAVRNFVQVPFLSGLNDLMKAIFDPEREGERFLARFTSGLVPTGIAALSRQIDPTIRTTEGIGQAIQAKIPFASERLPAKIGTFGEEIKRTGFGELKAGEPLANKLVELGLDISIPTKKLGSEKMTPIQFEEFSKKSGKEIKRRLSMVISDKEFLNIPIEDQQEIIDLLVNKTRKEFRGELSIK